MKMTFSLVCALLCVLAGCSKFHRGPKPDANGVFPNGTLAEGHSALQVHAADTRGNPVAGAHVRVVGEGVRRDGDVNKAGWSTLFFLSPGSYTVMVTKNGYATEQFPEQLQSKIYTSAHDTMQTAAEAQAEQEAKAKQRGAEEQAAKNRTIIDSLNLADVMQRCGQPEGGTVASIDPYFLYSYGPTFTGHYDVDLEAFEGTVKEQNTGQDIQVSDIVDVTLWFGMGGQPIQEADVDTDGSNHDKAIDKYTALPKVMPCLLNGGVAQ